MKPVSPQTQEKLVSQTMLRIEQLRCLMNGGHAEYCITDAKRMFHVLTEAFDGRTTESQISRIAGLRRDFYGLLGMHNQSQARQAVLALNLVELLMVECSRIPRRRRVTPPPIPAAALAA